MNYSEWLLQEYPKLSSSSSVKRFNYVKQAKSETRNLRFLASVPALLCVFLFSYGVGYAIGKYTNIELWVAVCTSTAIAVFISSRLQNKMERSIVQNKLKELVGKNA